MELWSCRTDDPFGGKAQACPANGSGFEAPKRLEGEDVHHRRDHCVLFRVASQSAKLFNCSSLPRYTPACFNPSRVCVRFTYLNIHSASCLEPMPLRSGGIFLSFDFT